MDKWIKSLESYNNVKFGEANQEESDEEEDDVSMINSNPLSPTPTNVTQALHSDNQREQCRKAIIVEVDAILSLTTWEHVDPKTASKVQAFKSKFAF